jgi:hypothetical protein
VRKNLLVGLSVGLVWVALFSGCEWETSDDVTDSWDTTAGWLNFSGVYRAANGGLLATSGTVVGTRDFARDTLGTGDGLGKSFAGTIQPTVVQGSVSVSDGFETFTDAGTTGGGGTNVVVMTGNLAGDKGGSGTVNYLTGMISVTFDQEPADGDEVFVTYLYESSPGGIPGDPISGSSKAIRSLTVHQVGNKITLTDNNGDVYTGTISVLTTTATGNNNAAESGVVVGQFDATGTSGGIPVHIIGTFLGSFTQPLTAGGTGALINRTLEGTWLEASGQSGTLSAAAADPGP